ncbi:glucuronyl hydrolase, partial [Clostridium botulinum D/C]
MKNISIEKIKDPNKFCTQKLLTKQAIESAINDAIIIIEKNMKKFSNKDKYPSSCCKNNKYDVIDNSEWTTGF